MKLEIGAGARTKSGHLAVDLNPACAGVVANALHLPFADASVEAIRAVDVLEHVSYRNTHEALCEWHRVLVPGGKLYVQVPDAHVIMGWYVNENPRLEQMEGRDCTLLEGATWRLLGGHLDGKYVDVGGNWTWNAHFALFSKASLRDALNLAGFETVEMITNGHPNICSDCVAR